MQDVVDQIMANPLFSLVLALLAFLLIFLILKSLFRIVLFLLAIFVLYAGYVYFLQEKYPLPKVVPETVDQLTKQIGDFIPMDLNLTNMDSNFTRPAPKN
jgi:predicted membrane protein